ncbi:hypothetical protein PAECIP111893_04239 [Paenibacillus plantiphilus]|uniref:Tissue inhibitor of metalloproteinase n=1 Tax=Paenibacillus plantiphilus TaxID=2905650 RepID=A0ABN8GX09_9BACL|nr:hypothetical protein [Paenibacillus plantiphilus]CAH1217235.1 hypothetical protein PAECIP111893_04239 [Paenibacillus plantiphilus]
MMGKRSLMILFCCLLAWSTWSLFKPEAVYACTCEEPSAIKEELKKKTAIFSGKITSISKPRKQSGVLHQVLTEITIKVNEVWKGDLGSEVIVKTGWSPEMCGYDGFEVDEEFLVYADSGGGQLVTGRCGPTKRLSYAGGDLAELGAGYAPTLHAPLEIAGDAVRVEGVKTAAKEESAGTWINGVIAIAGLAAMLLLMIVWKRYTRRS